MVFSGLTFLLLFLPLLLLVYFIRESIRWRNGVLVVFSLVFYAWGEPVMVVLLVATTLINFLCARGIAKSQRPAGRRLLLWLGVGLSLGSLVYFKYAGLLVSTAAALLHLNLSFTAPRLPIGISFYTFQIITYTVDVYRGRVPVQNSFWRLLLYVSCFPQLIAGPIVQYGDVADALSRRCTTPADFTRGMERFFLGLGKKVLLANVCGSFLLQCLPEGTAPLSWGGAWLSALGYTLQLYFDFSAYSDMAIGLGRVLGFTYGENFQYPFVSLSPSEFWRRWHISLGRFFREYVYIPLGGSRGSKIKTLKNLLIVWALTGLWHGASWNFLLWGLFWFLLQMVDKLLGKGYDRIPGVLRWGFTFGCTLIGFVIFYHTDLPLLMQHLRALFGGGLPLLDEGVRQALGEYGLFLPVAFVCALPLLPLMGGKLQKTAFAEPAAAVLSVGVGLLSLLFLIQQSYNPFIYFRF